MSKRRIAWLLLLVLLLWPIVGFTRYALEFVPGGGPQGGEAVMVLALMYWLLWQAIAIGHWIRLKRLRIGTRRARAAIALSPAAALAVATVWTDREWSPLPAAAIVLLLLAGPQLWAATRT